jgi:hypothetical protein
MNILEELNILLTAIPIPVETGVFSGLALDEYVVILPLSDVFEVHADNRPGFDVQEARISLFSKSNYLERKRQITTTLLNDDFTVTERRYIGHEDDTGYHHYAIDVAKNYGMEE